MSILGLSDYFGLATLVATILMLVYAIFAFWKEVKVERLQQRMLDLEHRIESGILQIEQNRIVEEICHSYIREAKRSSIYDYQKIKTHLETILHVSDRELVRLSIKTVLMMTNPLYSHSHDAIKSFFVTIWLADHLGSRKLNLDKEICDYYEHHFGSRLPSRNDWLRHNRANIEHL